MRITNKIMQNNSLYNINNNKVTENDISTQIMTGKKVNHPSDDPVIAIRALRLRANVTELVQYNTKNAEDADAWLYATETAISNTAGILTDIHKHVVSGPDKYKTLSDWDTIVTQIESLADEYYSTGNADYAGRYIFTGFRTNTTLTYNEATTQEYTDIHDEYNAVSIDTSARVSNKTALADGSAIATPLDPTLESDIQLYTVGRLRLAYDNIKVSDDPALQPQDVTLKYREPMVVSASSSVLPDSENVKTVDLSFTDSAGNSHTVHLPTEANNVDSPEITITNPNGTQETYKATANADGTFTVAAEWETGTPPATTANTTTFTINRFGVITAPAIPTAAVGKATASLSESKVTEIKYTAGVGTASGNIQQTVKIPLTDETKQPYTIDLGGGYIATVNTDGTYTLTDQMQGPTAPPAAAPNDATVQSVVEITTNGSIYSSYVEKSLTVDSVLTNTSTEQNVDDAYKNLAEGTTNIVFNAKTGEILFSEDIKNKLSRLTDIVNAKTLDVVYDKSEFIKGDTRPEHLFECTSEGVIYNSGTDGHTMAYDVGFNQKIEVNTTADEVFTNDVRRDAQDLRDVLNQMQDVSNKLAVLGKDLDAAKVAKDIPKQESIQKEIDAANKAYDYLTETMKNVFSHKITTISGAMDKANIATTTNGTRSKRLELIQSRLVEQTATFKELQSTNEDIDLADAATSLSAAKLTYQAGLQATGKIMTTSLMDYI